MLGWFDPEAVVVVVFDETTTSLGWCDRDLVTSAAAPPPPTAPPLRAMMGMGR